jgi:alpha-ribazole phosphatase
MAERIILLMRHGNTQLSSGKRLIGRCDVELSAEGLALCHRAGEALKRFNISHVFSSGLMRAKQTAQIICSYTGTEASVVEALGEISLGEWDGRFVDDIKNEYPEEYALRGCDIVNFRPPGGENLIDVKGRVAPAFRDLLKNQGNMLIVAHTSVNRAILASFTGIPLGSLMKIPQDYGACHILLQRGEEFFIDALNRIM